MEKPILTYEELLDAQQDAIQVHQLFGHVNERDVYAILKLDIDLAGNECFEERVSYSDICKFVRDVAVKYYDVRMPLLPVVRTLQPNTYGESFVNSNAEFKPKEENIMNVYKREMVYNKVKNKLQKLYEEKGCLTRKDVMDAMGVRTVDTNDYGKKVLLSSGDGKDFSVEVQAVIREIGGSVYLPYDLPFGLEPLKMWQTDNGYTTVEWTDGTTTSVSVEPGSATPGTPYGGFCACVVKKLYGSTSQAIKAMEHADKNAKWPAEKKRIEREKLKKMRQATAEMRRENEAKRREELIESYVEDIYAKREAERRVAEADTRKDDAL